MKDTAIQKPFVEERNKKKTWQYPIKHLYSLLWNQKNGMGDFFGFYKRDTAGGGGPQHIKNYV